jgi:hypothetical protein
MNPIGPGTDNTLLENNDYLDKPRYLEAITENNSPRYDWGPKKRINHYGLYAHLNALQSNNDIMLNGIRQTTGTEFDNGNFLKDNVSNKSTTEIIDERF